MKNAFLASKGTFIRGKYLADCHFFLARIKQPIRDARFAPRSQQSHLHKGVDQDRLARKGGDIAQLIVSFSWQYA